LFTLGCVRCDSLHGSSAALAMCPAIVGGMIRKSAARCAPDQDPSHGNAPQLLLPSCLSSPSFHCLTVRGITSYQPLQLKATDHSGGAARRTQLQLARTLASGAQAAAADAPPLQTTPPLAEVPHGAACLPPCHAICLIGKDNGLGSHACAGGPGLICLPLCTSNCCY
jgi:hypothetical protein